MVLAYFSSGGPPAGLAWLIRSRLPASVSAHPYWKASAIWMLQFALAALLLILFGTCDHCCD